MAKATLARISAVPRELYALDDNLTGPSERADIIDILLRTIGWARGAFCFGLSAVILFTACSGSVAGPSGSLASCSIPLESFVDGGIDRSGIPALTNPDVAGRLAAPLVGYVLLSDPVIGLHFNDQPLAIPLKLLWYHEVVNFDVPGERLTVTYSPLTGSSLVFNPAPSGTGDFTVSPYVLESNLVMEDGSGSLYPQMLGAGNCGPKDGVTLARVPYEQMSLAGWLSSFEDTWIVTRATGFDFLYTLYPYGSYRLPTNQQYFFPRSTPADPRRPPKERVLGVPSGSGGIAFPLSLLEQIAREDQIGQQPVFVWAADALAGSEPIVAFWNSLANSAVVYRRTTGGQTLTFEVVNGSRRDVQTGSIWSFGGRAVAGPLTGTQLAPHGDAYHAFWFAWADQQPDTNIWDPPIALSESGRTPPLGPPAEPIDWSLAGR